MPSVIDTQMSEAELWQKIQLEVNNMADEEPTLRGFLQASVLGHNRLGPALAKLLADKLQSVPLPAELLAGLFESSFADPDVAQQLICDITAIVERDSACSCAACALLYYKGFHALSAWRAAHQLWQNGQKSLAQALQHAISTAFGVDIHPAATIGKGIMFDHATGIVIGETAVIEDCVSILQSVTLGGTGKECGDRHPKVRKGVLIGPGAKILGNIEIGEGSKIIAASVVLQNIPPHSLVAGVPARVIGHVDVESPAELMDQSLNG
ncbi:MAG: serine O-acetyltransferase [Porticoccaceae bacterium]